MIGKILIALIDFIGALNKFNLIFLLGWQDIKQRYRRSKLGPFWLTISMGIMIAMIGIIFGQALSVSSYEYLPFVACGFIFWNFISNSINEGSTSFIHSAGMIRQLSLPLMLYPMRTLWRNILVLLHNIVILPLVMIIVGREINLQILWLFPGFLVLIVNILWVSVFFGILCTRFRDMPPIVSSILQVLFYLTPILWMPQAINARVSLFLVNANPIFHLMELVRAPILGNCPSLISWTVGIVMASIGVILTLAFFGMYKKRIAYWI